MDINDRIQSLLDRMTAAGQEQGIQVSVWHHGELVADAASGIADPQTGRKVTPETLFPVFSCSKGITATLVLQAVSNGLLNLNRPVADIWEDFAVNGKEKIPLAQILSHNSALPQLPKISGVEDLTDWQLMCRLTAAERPLWTPGSKYAYHAITFGWLVGNPLVIADGRDFNTVLQSNICRVTGEEFYFGLPDKCFDRLAVIEADPSPGQLKRKPYDPVYSATIPSELLPLEKWMNHPMALKSCIPASNGVGTARALAKHYSMVASGELLDSALLRFALREQHQTAALPEDRGIHGLGYWRMGFDSDGKCILFGHGGYGGTLACGDLKNQLGIAIVKNRMICTDKDYPPVAGAVLTEIYSALGVPQPAAAN